MKAIYSFKLQKQVPGLYEYAFTSIGKKGRIQKVVSFKEMAPDFYNVLLQDEVGGVRSGDITLSGNGDSLKVVNTVAAIIKEVLNLYTSYTIHIAGSDPIRNRIYQRKIKRELNQEDYMVLGAAAYGSDFVPLEDNVEYTAFLAFRK